MFFIAASFLAAAAAPTIPKLSEHFSVYSTEVDDTLGGEVIVQQFIARATGHSASSAHPQRMRMVANGVLVAGYMEQSTTCPGKMESYGGPTSSPENVTCTSFNLSSC